MEYSELPHALLGTCDTLEEVCEREGLHVSIAENFIATSEIERCDSCGWWCELNEMDEDNVCEDCRED